MTSPGFSLYGLAALRTQLFGNPQQVPPAGPGSCDSLLARSLAAGHWLPGAANPCDDLCGGIHTEQARVGV